MIQCNPQKESHKNSHEYDIIVYGGTSAGVIAAVSAKRLGKSVVIVEPTNHLGGLSSGGLGMTDFGNRKVVTHLSKDFYKRVGSYYDNYINFRFEPKVAEKVFNDYIEEADIPVIYQHRVIEVNKKGSEIQQITVQSIDKSLRKVLNGKYFIDCSYEGDLMARSGVSYTLGREPNEQYQEQNNGVYLSIHHQFPDNIDPYKVKGDTTSGLLWGIMQDKLETKGTGDKKIQAYCFRLCLTKDSNNRIPFYKPSNYDSTKYELLLRVIHNGKSWDSIYDAVIVSDMPNGKTDVNNMGPFSTDYIGGNYNYPDGTYEERDQIWKDHEEYTQGLLYFLSHDPRVPEKLRQNMQSWGYAKDEFTDNHGFPHQLYVREARRMIGEYVMTEHDCIGDSVVNDPIAYGAYSMDSHNCQRIIVNGMVKNEGNVNEKLQPYPISYRAITPKRSECTNLLVPVDLSASHIAYGSIRMEPVFMLLGQAAGIAASLAIDEYMSVQEVPYQKIADLFEKNPYLDNSRSEIILDTPEPSKMVGDWKLENHNWSNSAYGSNFYISEDLKNNERSIEIKFKVTETGNFDIYYFCPRLFTINYNDSKITGKDIVPHKVPIHLETGSISKEFHINFKGRTAHWQHLGEFQLTKDNEIELSLNGNQINGPIAFDALMLVPKK